PSSVDFSTAGKPPPSNQFNRDPQGSAALPCRCCENRHGDYLKDEAMRVIQVVAVLALALAGMSALSRYGKSTEPIADCPCAGCCRGVPTVRTPTAYALAQTTATDEPSDAASQSPPEKPETESAKPPETATELDDILAQWENTTSKIRRLNCEFSRF